MILFILNTSLLDNVLILLGETRCWSLWKLKDQNYEIPSCILIAKPINWIQEKFKELDNKIAIKQLHQSPSWLQIGLLCNASSRRKEALHDTSHNRNEVLCVTYHSGKGELHDNLNKLIWKLTAVSHSQGKPSWQLHSQQLWSNPLVSCLVTFQINRDWWQERIIKMLYQVWKKHFDRSYMWGLCYYGNKLATRGWIEHHFLKWGMILAFKQCRPRQ